MKGLLGPWLVSGRFHHSRYEELTGPRLCMQRGLLGALAFLRGVCKGWTEGTPVTGPPQKLPAPRLSQASQETPDPQGHHWLLEELSESCVWVCPYYQGPSYMILQNTAWMVERIPPPHPPAPRPSKLSSVGRQDHLQEQGDLPQGCCPPPQPWGFGF